MAEAGTLQVTAQGEREIAITRSFNAPRSVVFAALTKPDLIRRWLLGPDGWTMTVCDVDLRVGGAYRHVLTRGSDGTEMGWGGVYQEIAAPDRLVHTEVFDDPWYPGEAIVTSELVEEDGRTTMTATIRYEFREARDDVMASPMEHGLAASYERLEAVLASLGNV